MLGKGFAKTEYNAEEKICPKDKTKWTEELKTKPQKHVQMSGSQTGVFEAIDLFLDSFL